jgi:hypothetical protein
MTTCFSWYITSEKCVCSFPVRRKYLDEKQLKYSSSLSRYTSGFQPPSYLIRVPGSWADFGQTLWERMDTKFKYSISFHPQTDGKTEVVNRMLVKLLRGYNKKHPKTWDEQLFYIQHSYNRALHSSTNKSPFKTCFGYLPPSQFDIVYRQQKE